MTVTISALFTALDLIDSGFQLAEQFGRIFGATEEELAEIRKETDRRRAEAHTNLQNTD